jgi:hypothetical protein
VSAKSAAEWRAFWEERGMHELRLLLSSAWGAAGDGPDDTVAFRIASLLGSRAPRDAIAAELGRIRSDELGRPSDHADDERAAAEIADWFEDAHA